MSHSRDFWWRFKRNRSALVGVAMVAFIFAMAVVSLPLAPLEAVIANDLPQALKAPSLGHPFGTDYLGRDVLLRVMYGSRVSLLVGFSVVFIGMTVGTVLGLLAGYLGGWVDTLISRVVDIMLAFPFLLLAIAVSATLGPSLMNVVIALGVATFPAYVRLVRGSVLALREEQYVEAARALGARTPRILFLHILPNLLGTLLVFGTLRVSTAILAESGLSFLGLGAQPPEPTWGNMLADGREYLIFYTWLPLFPGLAILVTVMGFNFLGDGLRDVLDPKQQARVGKV